MKTINLKKLFHVSLIGLILVSTVIISKTVIANVKDAYHAENGNSTITSCIWDLIY
jgi:hypothetical protein